MDNQFVLLHERDTMTPLWVNMSLVTFIDRDVDGYTNLRFAAGSSLQVDEQPDDIVAKIQNTGDPS